MKFIVRWAFRLFIVVVVLAVALILSKDVLVKAIAVAHIRSQTGMDAKMGKLDVGLFSPTLTVEDFKLYNPAEFGGSPFLDIPDLHVEYDPRALATLKLRLKLVRIEVAEVNIVEDRDGSTNLILALEDLPVIPSPSTGQFDASSILGFKFAGIDTLNLTLGNVRYSSLRHPGKATEVKLGLKNEILTNVKSSGELRQLVTRTVFRNGITIVSDPPAVRPNSAAPRNREPTGTGPRRAQREAPASSR